LYLTSKKSAIILLARRRHVPTVGQSRTITILVSRATHHRRRCRPHPTRPSPVLVAMATIAKELHDILSTLIKQLTTMVADLQKIDAEQRDCLYKIDVMEGIRSADTKPPPTPLPTPLPATTNPVQSMNVMSTLHPELQWVVDEQKAKETPTS
jgi:hypothetical protein